LKRSGPPKRKTSLARGDKRLIADPEKTKAFVERGRQQARDRAREAQDMDRARTAGIHPGRARSAKPLTMTLALQTPFVARRSAREECCARCSTAARPRRADHWHHLLPQSQIRVFVRGLRLSPESTRALLKKLLRDERNLLALCADCHLDHEQPGATTQRLTGEEVPHEARVFALELGPEWAERLRKMYRSRSDA
jgi:hypothetical protein